ncbi:unnamed protein product [Aureobasidium uvarum]|uniref:Aminoglycoside phosphotransferase domain-containing protein n=1 Tax=Aureobasidium uvarum TaxID=2773716 RepID=A0A9N8KUF3_9PEZI|nr:unnamed protein product [Aureobasidium uvarum]
MDCKINVHYTCLDGDVPPMPSDAAIIKACNNAPKTLDTMTTSIVFSSAELVIKHLNVTFEECRNQIRAHELLDASIVVVPKVYRCFSRVDDGKMYLIMQRIRGEVRDRIEDCASVRRVADIVRHLQTHKSSIPGPLEGGISRGLFWENEHVDLRGEVGRLAEYIRRRLVGGQQGWGVGLGEFVLNHNDIAPRNLIWMTDGRICLIDWAHAGFYPKLLELVVLEFNTQEGNDLGFTLALSGELGPLSNEEEREVRSLNMAWFNSHRYRM